MTDEINIKTITIDSQGRYLIPLKKSGIPKLYAVTDNIPTIYFANEKTLYIELSEVIKWFEGESKNPHDSNTKKIIEDNITFLKSTLKKSIDNFKT